MSIIGKLKSSISRHMRGLRNLLGSGLRSRPDALSKDSDPTISPRESSNDTPSHELDLATKGRPSPPAELQ